MDETSELRQANERILELERQLAKMQTQQLSDIPPEEIAFAINKQQIDTLTYHLMKCQKQQTLLERRLRAAEAEAEAANERADSLERQLETAEAEKETLLERIDSGALEKKEEKKVSESVSDEEFDTVLDDAVSEKPVSRREPKRTFKDFIMILRRIGQIKLLDASLVLGVSQNEVLRWSGKLVKKGYLRVEGLKENRTLVATDKLIKKK